MEHAELSEMIRDYHSPDAYPEWDEYIRLTVTWEQLKEVVTEAMADDDVMRWFEQAAEYTKCDQCHHEDLLWVMVWEEEEMPNMWATTGDMWQILVPFEENPRGPLAIINCKDCAVMR